MSKKQKIEIHQSDELTQIDEELDFALEQLESANFTVGGLLEGIEAANREDEAVDEEAPPPVSPEESNAAETLEPPSAPAS